MSEIPTNHSPTNTAQIKSDFKRKVMANKSQTECSSIDKIDLITSEEIKPDLSIEENPRLLQRDKPKWSLRIKMQSPKDKESLSGKIY